MKFPSVCSGSMTDAAIKACKYVNALQSIMSDVLGYIKKGENSKEICMKHGYCPQKNNIPHRDIKRKIPRRTLKIH
ncbi:hypothetical protein TVAG_311360 [Trichomonas vaginalis G3]|uniref:Uncharacterized protein n=1 Tax=Trichomonas vaginalis (strain ATCC PRA-98 / G3) TaxID=412133 RepID=A2FX62_TRIV3|nr:hypothetical protein TVAGG3_0244220 [Trichomonas vaginalis G3]EAX90508.1 hypothetical protein TVAG_311360 [Trichomonas vaginalis G3]KAI5553547.1 hypothetical protein TVAGG3_0244220 [Trichomonas vaginalis G3]|eukprot:XP_001303438.1 hypothetical protein [Trichomonas vaginalis G3]